MRSQECQTKFNKLPSSESLLSTKVFESCAPGLHFLTVIELEILASRVLQKISQMISRCSLIYIVYSQSIRTVQIQSPAQLSRLKKPSENAGLPVLSQCALVVHWWTEVGAIFM